MHLETPAQLFKPGQTNGLCELQPMLLPNELDWIKDQERPTFGVTACMTAIVQRANITNEQQQVSKAGHYWAMPFLFSRVPALVNPHIRQANAAGNSIRLIAD